MMSLLSLTAWGRRREIKRESLTEYFRRGRPGACQTIHPEAIARNPLPSNVLSPDLLPDDRGWWGYSFRDVPARVSGATQIATIPDCRVLWYRDPAQANDFFPAVLTRKGTALDMREIRFRTGHAEALRAAPPARRVRRATWIVERVYHNHSHWLTAHLPKLLLLRELGRLDGVLLPHQRTPAMDGSMRLLGFEPDDFPTFGEDRFLEVDELTVLTTDRFRPDLLRTVPGACGVSTAPRGTRRVFISRSKAARRRLLNEEALWPLLDAAGFERVHLEAMSFEDQVSLMRQAAVLLAPHGAGLTNMLFVPPAADVIEMADPGFPNPNFYALAAALGHRYWLMSAQPHGDCHPLERDTTVEPDALRRMLERVAR